MRLIYLACVLAGTLFAQSPDPVPISRDVHPTLVSSADPEYSEQARHKKINGTVTIGLVVDTEGNPVNVHVINGVGYGLDEKAIEAVKQYKFKPAMKDGVAVATKLNIEVNFRTF